MFSAMRAPIEHVLAFLNEGRASRPSQYIVVGATMPGYVEDGAENARMTILQKFPEATWVRTKGLHRISPTLKQKFVPVALDTRKQVLLELVEDIAKDKNNRTLIFAVGRTSVEEATQALVDAGVCAFVDLMQRSDDSKGHLLSGG